MQSVLNNPLGAVFFIKPLKAEAIGFGCMDKKYDILNIVWSMLGKLKVLILQ